jgi:hypothetical protein
MLLSLEVRNNVENVSRVATAVGRHVENVNLRKGQALGSEEKLKSFLTDIARLCLYSGPLVRKGIT